MKEEEGERERETGIRRNRRKRKNSLWQKGDLAQGEKGPGEKTGSQWLVGTLKTKRTTTA